MKFSSAILFATCCLQISAKAFSQNPQTLSLQLKGASYEQAFAAIEQQSKVRIMYSDDLLPSNAIYLNVQGKPLNYVMDDVLQGTNLSYKIVKNKVIIVSKPEPVEFMQQNEIQQQTQTVTGAVTDENGNPLSGVSITIKGATKGVLTDEQGVYKINVPDNATLVFSYIGYQEQEINVANNTTINVKLHQLTLSTGADVVVTALGVKRSERSLSYNVQTVNNEQVNAIKTDNLMNALSGKVAGLTISSSASGIGGSVKVSLRGLRSVNGNNQPLYVIDGVPISDGGNANGQPNNQFGGVPDGGDGISNLNPEDIASISVLEGASAAALYGSQAQNGVILITTKNGAAGKLSVSFSSSFSDAHVAYKPDFQNSYGQTPTTTGTSPFSWGNAINGARDNLKDFFQDGLNATNSISLSAGNDVAQTYFSYANTSARGIQPTNKLQRNNFNLKEIGHFFKNKLTVQGNVMYVNQKINNSPYLGMYSNPLLGLYLFPRGVDILPYKENYLLSGERSFARQNWLTQPSIDDQFGQNPWWIINKEPNVATRNRIILGGNVRYDFTNWLNVQVRGNLDRITDNYESDIYSGTYSYQNQNGNGHLTLSNQTSELKYADAILNISYPNKSSKFQVGGLIGGSINDNKVNSSSTSGDLKTTDFFSVANIIAGQPNSSSYTLNNTVPVATHEQIQSVFANANLSYSNWAYLTLTARNDWSSNLSFTPTNHYFYPSAGLSVILSNLLKLPAPISYLKIRASAAEVGNTVAVGATHQQSTQDASGSLIINVNGGPGLKPEKTKSYEVGADLRFAHNRFNFSFTLYKTNTTNQYFPVQYDQTTLNYQLLLNAGNVQNEGFEFTLGGEIIKAKHFGWSTSFIGSLNRNKILEVNPQYGITKFSLTATNNFNFESDIVEGGSYGDLYGTVISRNDKGQIRIGGSGTSASPYKVDNNGGKYLGNPNPKFVLGWNNDFDIHRFNVHFLVDGKFGGQILSLTQAVMDSYGVSAATGNARKNNGGMMAINGVSDADNTTPITSISAQDYYSSVGGRSGIMEPYIYSATVVRLRELSVGYNFPLSQTSFFKNIKLSLIGRNLAYFYKKAPFDPEITMSTGNGLSGVDIFGQPATRNIGLNLGLNF